MNKKEKEEIVKQKALKISIAEGSANSFSTGISNSYITPFALKLSSKDLNIGILSSISGLIAPLAQLYGSRLMTFYARKNIVLKAVIWQAILWLPLAIIALLKFYSLYENSLIYLLIIVYSLITALGGLGHPLRCCQAGRSRQELLHPLGPLDRLDRPSGSTG